MTLSKYTSKGSPGSVRIRPINIIESIEAMVELLSENPRIARERLEISPPVRIHPFHSHLIVYMVDDNNDIFIIRIRHGHEDWQSNPD